MLLTVYVHDSSVGGTYNQDDAFKSVGEGWECGLCGVILIFKNTLRGISVY